MKIRHQIIWGGGGGGGWLANATKNDYLQGRYSVFNLDTMTRDQNLQTTS